MNMAVEVVIHVIEVRRMTKGKHCIRVYKTFFYIKKKHSLEAFKIFPLRNTLLLMSVDDLEHLIHFGT